MLPENCSTSVWYLYITKNQIGLKLDSLKTVQDRINLLNCSLFIHQQIRGSQLFVVKAGYQSLVEKHSKVNNAINTFMKSL